MCAATVRGSAGQGGEGGPREEMAVLSNVENEGVFARQRRRRWRRRRLDQAGGGLCRGPVGEGVGESGFPVR